jgi:hypothetical protein
MLIGSVFARRVSGVAMTPGWAERAVNAIWMGMAPRLHDGAAIDNREIP